MHLFLGKLNPENEKKMKTINYFSIAFAGLAMFCACTKAELGDNAPVNEGGKVELVAGEGQIVCATPPMTKTAVGAKDADGSYPVIWLDQDQVKVYGASSTEGVVYTASITESSTEAIFNATSNDESENDVVRYAVYPASMAGTMAPDGCITVDLARLRNQEYHSNIPNFGQYDKYPLPETVTDMTQKEYYESLTVFPNLPLWAKAEDGGSFFSFNNLMGVVKLALNDYQGNNLIIKSIKMTAKSPISGTMTVDADGKVTVAGDEDANTVTIFSKAGVKIMASSSPGLHQAGSPFYFFIPVGTYEGFDFEITTTDGRIFRKSTATVVEVQPGIVKKFPVLNFTLFYGKANCYQIANASSVDIDITPRYSFDMTFNGAEVEYLEGMKPTFTPEIVWNLTRNGKNLQGTSLTGTPSIEGNVLKVNSNHQGNGLVAIKNADGKIVWSYHIWVVNPTEQPVTDVNYEVGSDSFYMMSHNLGAIHKVETDANNVFNSYGMFYQWGRKEPLPAYGVQDDYNAGVTALFEPKLNVKNTIADAIANPLTMYINYDEKVGKREQSVAIYPQTTANNGLWGATQALSTDVNSPSEIPGFVKTVYDPCPEGYMVPQVYHFNGMSIANYSRKGYGALLYYDADKTSNAFYPLAGVFLSTDDVVSETLKTTGCGGSIRCHTSNPVGTTGWASAFFRAQFSGGKISIDRSYGGLANACSIRCLKIERP